MRFLGFGSRRATHLVVVTREGPGHMRLNGNHVRKDSVKQNALNHSRTVCWIEYEPKGPRIDQGLGPAATQLEPGAAERLLSELPQTEVCKQVLRDLEGSPAHSARWLPWAGSKAPLRGSMGDHGKQ